MWEAFRDTLLVKANCSREQLKAYNRNRIVWAQKSHEPQSTESKKQDCHYIHVDPTSCYYKSDPVNWPHNNLFLNCNFKQFVSVTQSSLREISCGHANHVRIVILFNLSVAISSNNSFSTNQMHDMKCFRFILNKCTWLSKIFYRNEVQYVQ